jgi:hypothetical protein
MDVAIRGNEWRAITCRSFPRIAASMRGAPRRPPNRSSIAVAARRAAVRRVLKCEAMDSVHEHPGMKIEEETDTVLRQTKIIQHLSFEDWRDADDTLHFDHDGVFDDQIDPVMAEDMAFVRGFDRHLTHVLDPAQVEFDAKRAFVDRFGQSGAQSLMDFDCRANDP